MALDHQNVLLLDLATSKVTNHLRLPDLHITQAVFLRQKDRLLVGCALSCNMYVLDLQGHVLQVISANTAPIQQITLSPTGP